MFDEPVRKARYGEAFWRSHHEAWKRSDLNQREYCEVQGLSLKAFGNWRAKFKAEPDASVRKLLYRRGGLSHRLSHTLSHSLSHTLSHWAYPSSDPNPAPIVPPSRPGHRRRFSETDRRHILAEADKPGASVSEVTRRFGIDRRVLFRWLQEEATARPAFVTVEVTDGTTEEIDR